MLFSACRRIRLSALGFGMAFLASAASFASDATPGVESISERRARLHFIDASSNNFPPVNILDSKGRLTGFGADLSKAVIRAVGGTVVHRHSGIWPEVVGSLMDGHADFIHDTGYNAERAKVMDFTQPILSMPERIFVRADEFGAASLDALKGRPIACVQNHITHHYLKKQPGIQCRLFRTPEEALFALVNGSVEAFPYPRQIMLALAQKLKVLADIKEVGEPLRVLNWHMVVRKGDQEMLALLERGISTVRNTGEYDQLYEKWFGRDFFGGYSEGEVVRMMAFAVVGSVLTGGLVVLLIYTRRLRRARAEVRAANLALEQRVKERTRELRGEVAERIRAEKNAALANKAKSDFLSSMSHELRTPMNAILGFAQLLLYSSKMPLQDKQREYLELILKSGRYLLELINEVLELSKIESGRVSVSMESIDMQMLLNECLPLIEVRAREAGVRVDNLTAQRRLPKVYADRTRLKQVLLNILSNAVKYNRENGFVSLDAMEAASGKLRIAISDGGIGIPEDMRDQIFKPFSRLVDSSDSNVEGTGIGLAITRRLVEMMNGHVDFESSEGEGTTFWVEMPIYTGQSEAEVQISEPQNETWAGGHRTVLYVEDNPANVRLMEEVLGDMADISLVSAHNGEMGVLLAREYRPDVILLDINLPGLNGYEVLAELRAGDSTRDVPVIAVSANAAPHDIRKGKAAGFRAYLTKPIDIDELMVELNDLFSG